jgi:CHASE3 domain sensor protein
MSQLTDLQKAIQRYDQKIEQMERELKRQKEYTLTYTRLKKSISYFKKEQENMIRGLDKLKKRGLK